MSDGSLTTCLNCLEQIARMSSGPSAHKARDCLIGLGVAEPGEYPPDDQTRPWMDPELLRAAREWADVERKDAPEGSDTRLTYTLMYTVLDDAVRRAMT